jgi:hypothetical protein
MDFSYSGPVRPGLLPLPDSCLPTLCLVPYPSHVRHFDLVYLAILRGRNPSTSRLFHEFPGGSIEEHLEALTGTVTVPSSTFHHVPLHSLSLQCSWLMFCDTLDDSLYD